MAALAVKREAAFLGKDIECRVFLGILRFEVLFKTLALGLEILPV